MVSSPPLLSKVPVARPGLLLTRIRHGGLQAAQDGADLRPRRDSDKDFVVAAHNAAAANFSFHVCFRKSCNRSMVPPSPPLPSLPLEFPTRPGFCILSASAPVSVRDKLPAPSGVPQHIAHPTKT